jgi:hypothetical protein
MRGRPEFRRAARIAEPRKDRLISWITLLAGATLCIVAVLLS